MTYVYSIVSVAAIFSLLTVALNLHFGVAGLVNFGIVAYFAVGAYTYVILTQLPPTPLDQYEFGFELSPWIGIVGGIAAAVAFAAATGWPALRLREEYLALTTFAFAEVLH
ncbi:MAG: ABC transporter permease subunit, partial [Pseudonocardiaceae bacterium]